MRKKIILGMALLLLVSLRCFGIIDRPNESHYMPDDTTVYDVPDKPAQLLDAVAYFKKNNRYNDWDKNDRKRVTLQGVVEKDSTITNVTVLRSSKIDKLDKEAMRLIKSAKYEPGLANVNGWKTARTRFTIHVFFRLILFLRCYEKYRPLQQII